MSTLAEIETATDALPREELEKLLRFVAMRLRTVNQPAPAAAKSKRKNLPRKPRAAAADATVWRPPAPKAMGKFLAPESEWTDLCHR